MGAKHRATTASLASIEKKDIFKAWEARHPDSSTAYPSGVGVGSKTRTPKLGIKVVVLDRLPRDFAHFTCGPKEVRYKVMTEERQKLARSLKVQASRFRLRWELVDSLATHVTDEFAQEEQRNWDKLVAMLEAAEAREEALTA